MNKKTMAKVVTFWGSNRPKRVFPKPVRNTAVTKKNVDNQNPSPADRRA
jgi:hypothetical protein